MNNKITFPELVDLVAQATNSTKRVSELFLKELFATVTQALVDGDSVKIKGLGTFRLTEVSPRKSVNVNTGETIEIPGHNKLTFIADKELADAVNTPFAQFDTVTLDDDVTDEALQSIDNGEPLPDDATEPSATELHMEQASDCGPDANGEEHPQSEPSPTPPPFAPVAEPEVQETAQAEPQVLPPPFVATHTDGGNEDIAEPVIDTPETDDEPETPFQEESQEESAKLQVEADEVPIDEPTGTPSRFDDEEYITDDEIAALEKKATLKGFLWGTLVGILICAIAGYLWLGNESRHAAVPAEVVADSIAVPADTVVAPAAKTMPTDTAKAIPAQKQATDPTPKVVYETVTITNVPARMARRHYGKECFWVYIYEENKGKIKNPNNIKEGTRLVIPPKEKYGIDKNDPKSVKKAQRLLYNLQKSEE